MNGKKKARTSYTTSKDADTATQDYIDIYNILKESDEPEDVVLVADLDEQMNKLVDTTRGFGKLSAIELLGKLGRWMSKNDIISIGREVKVDEPDERRPNIYR